MDPETQLTPGARQALLRLRVAALESEAAGSGRHFGAWIRYGKRPVGPDDIRLAATRYRIAVLQPWELTALRALKAQRPDMVVLCYKCLSSTRIFEGSDRIPTSGVTFAEAEQAGEAWFAHRRSTGERVEWTGYPGHLQMAVWNEDYRQRWVENVVNEVSANPWDGVFADNDVFDDYYGLGSLAEVADMAEVRQALGTLVKDAGEQLNLVGKLLVPNIAESRREPGRWVEHARYGGGFEEHWLGWQPDTHFDDKTCEEQAVELHGPGIGVVRVNAGGVSAQKSFRYGVAAFWVLGGGRGWACTATVPDEFDGLPYLSEQSWDLGQPLGPTLRRDGGRAQLFTAGWAAVNLGDAIAVTFEVPIGFVDADGDPAPSSVTLGPKEGCLYATPRAVERALARVPQGPLLALDVHSTSSDAEWLTLEGGARLEGGLLRLPVRADYQDLVISKTWFCPSGWAARARLDVPAYGPSAEMLLELQAESGERLSIGKSGGALLLRLELRGQLADQTKTFDGERHRWWALGVEPERVLWLTSRDGVSWHVERELIGSRFARAQVRVALLGGHFEEESGDEEAGFGVFEVVEFEHFADWGQDIGDSVESNLPALPLIGPR